MAIYDRFASRYDRLLRPFEKLGLAKWRSETLSLLPHNASILEIGAGTGANFSRYPVCRHAAAAEISIKMLEIARGKATFQDLVQADAQRLPFAANSFDAAFATMVFCSVSDPAGCLAETLRTIRPGGSLVLLEHVRPPGILGRAFDVLNAVTARLAGEHINRQTAANVEFAGAEIIEVRPHLLGIFNLIQAKKPAERA